MLSYSLAKTSVETSGLEIVNCTIGQITIHQLIASSVVDGGYFVIDTPHNCFYLGGQVSSRSG